MVIKVAVFAAQALLALVLVALGLGMLGMLG